MFVEHTRANLEPRPCFLLGRGMGATIAIQVMRAFVEIEEERKREAQSLSSTPDQHARGLRAPTTAAATSFSSSTSSLPSNVSYSVSPFQTPNSPRVEVDDSDARAALWHWHGCVLISPAIIPPQTVSPLAEMLAHLCYDFLPKVPHTPPLAPPHPPPTTVALSPASPSLSLTSVSSCVLLRPLCPRLSLASSPSRTTAASRGCPRWWRSTRADPLVVKAPMVARWAVELLQTMNELREDSHTIRFPFFVLQGSEDSFVHPAGAEWMYKRSQSKDKKSTAQRQRTHTQHQGQQPWCSVVVSSAR